MTELHTTASILMVRPANFGFNEQTAASNAFQHNGESVDSTSIAERAIVEFDEVVRLLREKGVRVLVIEDSAQPVKPDAVFPNNWLTTHADGTAVTYPMESVNRRAEIRDDILNSVGEAFHCERRLAFENETMDGEYLEGTGSLVLDRANQIAYACQSTRTNETLAKRFCQTFDYRLHLFDAVDLEGTPIYHTNVMLSIGESWAVVGFDSIPQVSQREELLALLWQTGKQIVNIDSSQIEQFAGNVLQLRTADGKPLVVMSSTALASFSPTDLQIFEEESEILSVDIPTIETYGGGSVRCMIAELFLTPR